MQPALPTLITVSFSSLLPSSFSSSSIPSSSSLSFSSLLLEREVEKVLLRCPIPHFQSDARERCFTVPLAARGPQGRVTLVRFVAKETGGKEQNTREKWTKRAPSRQRGRRERILSWDRVSWGGWGVAARGGPLSGKSAGVRTEMLRDRVGRGCPLTT